MNKTVTLFGFGKIVIGLLYPVISRQLKNNVIIICCVRASNHWLNIRERHSTIVTSVRDYSGLEKSSTKWQFSEKNESFCCFVERCKKLNNPGIWVLEDEQMLSDALKNSTVLGTSVGVESLDDLLNQVDKTGANNTTFYAFENQATAVYEIAQKHTNTKLIHCPIDRVVVSREFDDDNGFVVVRLGKDPSESVMIYDVDGEWTDILDTGRTSSLTVTGDTSLLKKTIGKKQYAKNNVHKIICQIAAGKKTSTCIRDKALCDIITQEDVNYINSLKSALLLPAVISIISAWSNPTRDIYHDIYRELSSYFDLSLATVTTDSSDRISRIIHLDSKIKADNDKERLLLSLEELQSFLSEASARVAVSYLAEDLGTDDIAFFKDKIDEVKRIIANNNWDDIK